MAPSSSSPRTTLTWILPTVRGTHQFEIDRYSLHKGLGAGNPVTSGTFAVGGYEWAILFYPDGRWPGHHQRYVSVFVKLVTKDAKVEAFVDLRPVDRTTGLSCSVHPVEHMFFGAFCGQPIELGISDFMWRGELVESSSPYIRGDRLIIECVLDVVQEQLVTPAMRTARGSEEVPVPSSDLSSHLGELLESQVGGDLTFLVQGEVFGAHRVVLAMRSPVFKAQLYGPMKEKDTRRIAVDDDMQPLVFRALLHFIYTDELLVPGGLEAEEYREVIRHLLVAADRYAMERLKAICELVLCRTMEAKDVAATLTLADRHYCKGLKDLCDQFVSSLGLEE